MPRTDSGASAAHQNAVLAALEDGRCLDLDALVAATGLERRRAKRAACSLVLRGLAERAAVGCYRPTPDGLAQKASGRPVTSAPRTRYAKARYRPASLRVRFWRAMRVRQHEPFTTADLVRLVARDGEDLGRMAANAREYVAWLVKSGHLALLRARTPRDGKASWKRYRLIRNSGPEAPVVAGDRASLRDPNTGVVHALAGEAAP